MTNYLCKDCKHAVIPKKAYLSYLFELKAPASHWYKCGKTSKGVVVKDDPVTGPKTVFKDMDYCAVARINDTDRCGPDAKYWEPKHKKDLFKFLAKDDVI